MRPREWQSQAHRLWTENNRGTVRVVTGGGKTVFAYLCMKTFFTAHPGGRVIIVVPTTALLDQWAVAFTDDFQIERTEIACYSAQERPENPRRYNILVINTARQVAPRIAEGQPALLIVDECHRAGSSQNALALRGAYAATLGLSATPEREYDEGFEAHIKPVLGDVIFSYGYAEAARDGIISPFALHNIRVPLLPDEQASYDELTRRISRLRHRLKYGEGSDDALIRLLRRRAAGAAMATMRIPVAARIADEHRGSRTLLFHERVSAANQLAEILVARSHSVTVYHAGIPGPIRRDNLRLFRKGVFDILVCCRALDEGINVPQVSTAIIASSTASARQRIQRMGRALRPAPGKRAADIYTIYATDLEESRLSSEARTLQDVAEVTWRRAGA